MGVVEEIRGLLAIYGAHEPLPEIGCFRRNVWTQGDLSWKLRRSNILLAALGYPYLVTSVTGSKHTIYILGGHLLQFRGGPWKNHWSEDIDLLSALVRTQYEILGTILLWENEGEISINELPLPEGWERVAAAVQEDDWTYADDNPPRIRKDSQRASACFYCPVKSRCDATDRLFTECGDWPEGYKAGPPHK